METGREVELKLSVPPDRVQQLLRSPHLKAEGAGRGHARALRNTYYDTPHLTLHERGLALRVREAGRRFVQTVKTGGRGASGLFKRREWQQTVAGPKPDLGQIDDLMLRELLGDAAARLAPVFTADVRRVTRTIRRDNATRVEVVIDEGRVVTPKGSTPICEIEFELKEGSPDALYELALALNDVAPLRLETMSKSDRGYALLSEAEPSWSKAPPFALDINATGLEAFEAILRHHLAHLLANEAAAHVGGDPEGVHQVRVALRRLRSVLALFREVLPAGTAQHLGDELRWLAGETGSARDLDVFLQELLSPIRRTMPEEPDLEALENRATAARIAAYERVRTAFATTRYTALLLEVGRVAETRFWLNGLEPEVLARLEAPARDFASDLLAERHRKAKKRGRGFANLSTSDRHRLRIGLKKLRYAADSFRTLYEGGATAAYMKRLSRLQDVLGHLNDVDIAGRLVEGFAQGAATGDSVAVARASGLVIGWYGHGIAALEPRLRKQWKAFKSAQPFWEAGGA
ncbi:MAG TPA: CHAD domain-containing protein [Stellaceae bacterium]|nr:CHAD domain-containing protein [Stellaceae bacterium]